MGLVKSPSEDSQQLDVLCNQALIVQAKLTGERSVEFELGDQLIMVYEDSSKKLAVAEFKLALNKPTEE